MSGTKQVEGLLTPGIVRLYGRPYVGLAIGRIEGAPGASNPLAAALTPGKGKTATLARIYAVGFLGEMKTLNEPAIITVFTQGQPVTRAPGAAEDDELMVWLVDRLDLAVRIDTRTGSIDDLLLADSGAGVRRGDTVGRDGALVGRDGALIGRDGALIGR